MEAGSKRCNIAGFEVDKGAISQGMWVLFRNLKRHGKVFSLRVFKKEYSPADNFDFSPISQSILTEL